jgi:hypothetical protein
MIYVDQHGWPVELDAKDAEALRTSRGLRDACAAHH